MKLWAIVFFLLPLIGCAYVGWHVWRLLPLTAFWKTVSVVMLLACFVLFVMNFVIGLDRMPMPLARIMYDVGNSSVIILLYLVMLFLLLDAARLLHLLPASFLKDSMLGTLCISGFMVVLFCYANIHYHHKVRVPIEIDSHGKVKQAKKLVMMSDLHLGYHNGRKELARWVDLVNAEKPDYVLIAGDIIDISVRPLLEENVAEEFKRLKAPVFACLGNHEYYSGEPRAQQFYHDAGIRLLRDSVAVIDGDLAVIGRDDRTNSRRRSLANLVAEVKNDSTPYLLLLDHQPYHLEQAEQVGIGFQFSGHTHYGQVWPLSWIEDLMYECAFGSHQRGNTRYYVSSGIGIWGGKFRIGTRSEYVVATIH